MGRLARVSSSVRLRRTCHRGRRRFSPGRRTGLLGLRRASATRPASGPPASSRRPHPHRRSGTGAPRPRNRHSVRRRQRCQAAPLVGRHARTVLRPQTLRVRASPPWFRTGVTCGRQWYPCRTPARPTTAGSRATRGSRPNSFRGCRLGFCRCFDAPRVTADPPLERDTASAWPARLSLSMIRHAGQAAARPARLKRQASQSTPCSTIPLFALPGACSALPLA
jgi:hypothetical protein